MANANKVGINMNVNKACPVIEAATATAFAASYEKQLIATQTGPSYKQDSEKTFVMNLGGKAPVKN